MSHGYVRRKRCRRILQAGNCLSREATTFPPRSRPIRIGCERTATLLFLSARPTRSQHPDFYEWAKHFVEETSHLRNEGQNLLLIRDGFGGHVQYRVLQLLRHHDIVVIGLPAHTSHVLQPLDVTVFGPFKSYMQKEIHRMALLKPKLDAFDVAQVLKVSLSSAKTASNVSNGFRKTGLCDEPARTASIVPLEKLQYFSEQWEQAEEMLPSLEDVVTSFRSTGRSLLRPQDVEDEGIIKISNRSGVHLTAEAILNALKRRDERRHPPTRRQREAED